MMPLLFCNTNKKDGQTLKMQWVHLSQALADALKQVP